jgi:hypothetical protein
LKTLGAAPNSSRRIQVNETKKVIVAAHRTIHRRSLLNSPSRIVEQMYETA